MRGRHPDVVIVDEATTSRAEVVYVDECGEPIGPPVNIDDQVLDDTDLTAVAEAFATLGRMAEQVGASLEQVMENLAEWARQMAEAIATEPLSTSWLPDDHGVTTAEALRNMLAGGPGQQYYLALHTEAPAVEYEDGPWDRQPARRPLDDLFELRWAWEARGTLDDGRTGADWLVDHDVEERHFPDDPGWEASGGTLDDLLDLELLHPDAVELFKRKHGFD